MPEYLPLCSLILLGAIAAVQFIGESQADTMCNAAGFGGEPMLYNQSLGCCLPESVQDAGGDVLSQAGCGLEPHTPQPEHSGTDGLDGANDPLSLGGDTPLR